MRYASAFAALCFTTFALGSSGCGDAAGGDRPLTIGVSFETLQTGFWVGSFAALEEEFERRNIRMLHAIADGDSNRQFEQVRNFITRRVDGIIIIPKDSRTVIPMIRAANQANIPIVLFNRPPDESDARSVAVVADNRALTRETVGYLVEQARQTGRRHKAMILIGDLGDINAVERREGFDEVVANNTDIIEVVARVPTEWNQERAQAGVANALQAHPDISFIFTSSDFLLPSIVSALRAAGKYHRIGEEGHVILGGFDGDPTAYQMLIDGYLDATGVQDVYFEARASVEAVLDMIEGREIPERILDPGFVIHQRNLHEKKDRMWGAQLAAPAR